MTRSSVGLCMDGEGEPQYARQKGDQTLCTLTEEMGKNTCPHLDRDVTEEIKLYSPGEEGSPTSCYGCKYKPEE